MKHFLPVSVIFYILYFIFYIRAYADVASQPIYGGGQMFVSQGFISIDKKVASPQSRSIWVDNLTINDPKYRPESVVNFQLLLTNIGNTEIKQVMVKDALPQFISFVHGPGSFDPNTKTLTFEVNDLKPNETRTFEISGKIASENQLPIDTGAICMVNQVTAQATNSGTSQDSTVFCVEKEVLAAQTKGGFPVFPPQDLTTTPATGPQTLILFSLLPAGVAGWLLRKYS